jgi:ammonium transporter, Amt family
VSQLALAATQYVPFDSKKLNSGDTAWVLAAAALVLLMTPGLAFFYGGMVRAKHILGMLIQNFAAIAVVSVTWILVGFSLAFSGEGKFLGDLHFFGMQNVNDVVPAMGTAQTIPTLAFVAFQVTFAIITPALVTGAAADRWKFGAFVAFVTVWSIVIYAPVAHWVFDGYGWLNRSLQPAGKFFAEDFAGGTVVHINAGAAGLAMALVLGKRRGWPREKMRGNNIPFVMLGAGLLWFGWFGFNAGSALTAGNLASYAWVNTNTATATALLALSPDWWRSPPARASSARSGRSSSVCSPAASVRLRST